jgi:hypothetical protein
MTITLTVRDAEGVEVLSIERAVSPSAVYPTVNSPTPCPVMAMAAFTRLLGPFESQGKL